MAQGDRGRHRDRTLLNEAKDELDHGEFLAMIEDKLPFGARTAQMLMGIAKHPIIGNAKYISHLPPSWGTLYELTKIPDEELKQMIAEGRINSELERKAVDDVLKTFRDEGVYLATLPKRLVALIGFMDKWPNVTGLIEHVVQQALEPDDENDEDFDIDELKKLARWILKLHAACRPKYKREVRELERIRAGF
jgi:hypothetical protein